MYFWFLVRKFFRCLQKKKKKREKKKKKKKKKEKKKRSRSYTLREERKEEESAGTMSTSSTEKDVQGGADDIDIESESERNGAGAGDIDAGDLSKITEEIRKLEEELELAPPSSTQSSSSKVKKKKKDDDEEEESPEYLKVDPEAKALLEKAMGLVRSKEDEEGKKNNYDEALKCLERCVRLQPTWVAAHLATAQVLQLQEKFEQAELVLRSVAGLAFDHPQVWSALGLNLYTQGKIQEAVEMLRLALTGGPYGRYKNPGKDPMVLFCLAFFLALLGHLAEPATLFMKLVQSGNASPASLYMMYMTSRHVSDEVLASRAKEGLLMAHDQSEELFNSEMIAFKRTFVDPLLKKADGDEAHRGSKFSSFSRLGLDDFHSSLDRIVVAPKPEVV